MDYYEIKRNYTDFRVTEIANLDLSGGEYHCYLLYKCGIRTIEAVQLISEKLGIYQSSVNTRSTNAQWTLVNTAIKDFENLEIKKI